MFTVPFKNFFKVKVFEMCMSMSGYQRSVIQDASTARVSRQRRQQEPPRSLK